MSLAEIGPPKGSSPKHTSGTSRCLTTNHSITHTHSINYLSEIYIGLLLNVILDHNKTSISKQFNSFTSYVLLALGIPKPSVIFQYISYFLVYLCFPSYTKVQGYSKSLQVSFLGVIARYSKKNEFQCC